jgi:hypothetical protein
MKVRPFVVARSPAPNFGVGRRSNLLFGNKPEGGNPVILRRFYRLLLSQERQIVCSIIYSKNNRIGIMRGNESIVMGLFVVSSAGSVQKKNVIFLNKNCLTTYPYLVRRFSGVPGAVLRS